MDYFEMDLQYFAEGGGAAAPAEGGESGSDAAENSLPEAGETLADGTKVDARLAAALKDQAKRHPELKDRYAKARAAIAPDAAQAGNGAGGQTEAGEPGGKTPEEEWEEAKKGRFKDFFGRDVKAAVDDRFKNHQDLDKYEPMLKILREKAGVDSNDALMESIVNDDSVWEKKAEEMGMTIEGAKAFTQMEEELEQRRNQEKQDLEQKMFRDHFTKLVQQSEALKTRIPGFDLRTELQNEAFRRMTAPDVGVPVEAAYFAVHHGEMMPKAIAYGIQKGVKQVSESIQAGQRRPAEGAMQGNAAAAAPVTIDPRKLTRAQRDEMVRQARLGKRVTFE